MIEQKTEDENRVNWGLPLHWDTHFAKQANLFNGGPIYKTWTKKKQNLFPFIAQENTNKNFHRRTTTDFVLVK